MMIKEERGKAVTRTRKFRRKAIKIFPVIDYLEYLSVRWLAGLANFLPISFSTWIARRVGDLLFVVLTSRRRVAMANLETAFGSTKSNAEKKRIARAAFRNMVTCFMEFFRLPKFMRAAGKHVVFEGAEHMTEALARGRGFILVMSHIGPWEYLGFIPYLRKIPAAILGRSIKNPYLYGWIRSIRKNLKLDYIDKDAGPKPIFSKLKANYGIGIAIDQWAGNDGIWVNFFGKPTSTTAIPAEFAKRTGCALIPAYCARTASGEYKIHTKEAIFYDKNDVDWIKNATEKLNGILEEAIREFPEQWLWLHKRWKSDNKFTRLQADLPAA